MDIKNGKRVAKRLDSVKEADFSYGDYLNIYDAPGYGSDDWLPAFNSPEAFSFAKNHECKTTACVAGYTCLELVGKVSGRIDYYKRAKKLLGLNKQEADFLFLYNTYNSGLVDAKRRLNWLIQKKPISQYPFFLEPSCPTYHVYQKSPGVAIGTRQRYPISQSFIKAIKQHNEKLVFTINDEYSYFGGINNVIDISCSNDVYFICDVRKPFTITLDDMDIRPQIVLALNFMQTFSIQEIFDSFTNIRNVTLPGALVVVSIPKNHVSNAVMNVITSMSKSAFKTCTNKAMKMFNNQVPHRANKHHYLFLERT